MSHLKGLMAITIFFLSAALNASAMDRASEVNIAAAGDAQASLDGLSTQPTDGYACPPSPKPPTTSCTYPINGKVCHWLDEQGQPHQCSIRWD
jgi:hypothetical protein